MPQAGAFFGGLVRGFGDTWSAKEKERRDREQQDKETRIRVLEAAAKDPNLTDEGRESIWRQLHEITGMGGAKPGKPDSGDVPLQGQIGAIVKAHANSGTQSPALSAPAMTENTPIGGSSTQLPPPPPPPGAAPSISAGPQAPAPSFTATAGPSKQPALTPAVQTTPVASGVSAPPAPTVAPTAAAVRPAVTAPPAPPHMYLTHAEQQQRLIDDTVNMAKANAEVNRQNKAQTVKDVEDALEQRGIKISDSQHARIIEQVHGVKLTGGAVHYGRDQVPVEQIPDDAIDAHTGQAIDKSKVKYVREVYEGNEFKGYTAAGAPKPTAVQQKFNMKLDDWKSANPKKAGESDDDYTTRATQTVHQQQYDADSKRLIGLGLRNQATAANIQRIQKELKNSDSLSYKSAKVLWDGAWRAARLRAQNDMDAIGRPLHELVDEELNKLGTGYNEVAEGLRQTGNLPATTTSKKKPPAPPAAGGSNPLGLNPTYAPR